MRPFFVIWTGQAFSLLGSQLVQFAIVWWLTRATGSATMLALATLVALLPQIILGPFAGALVDRWSRRVVMIVADTVIAVATLALALLFWRNVIQVWHIYLLLLVRAMGGAFHWPAMQASTPLMVPQKHLPRIAGLNQTLGGLAGILIPPLGALAIEALPMQGVLAIDVLTAAPAIVSLLFIAIPQPPRAPAPQAAAGGSSLWADMREGLHFVLGWRALLVLSMIGVLINMLGRAAASLTPILITQHFQGGALQLGWWQSAAGVGAVLGGVILGAWGGFRRRVVTQMAALVLDGLAIIAHRPQPAGGLFPGGSHHLARGPARVGGYRRGRGHVPGPGAPRGAGARLCPTDECLTGAGPAGIAGRRARGRCPGRAVLVRAHRRHDPGHGRRRVADPAGLAHRRWRALALGVRHRMTLAHCTRLGELDPEDIVFYMQDN